MKLQSICILLLASILSIQAEAKVDCKIHKVYCHITKVYPKALGAMYLSNTIYKASKRYNVDPHHMVAIGMQETWLGHYPKKGQDLGMFQISRDTANSLRLDVDRLQWDTEYNIYSAARILRLKIRECKRLGLAKGEEWTTYHSFTKRVRLIYKKRAVRYLYATKS